MLDVIRQEKLLSSMGSLSLQEIQRDPTLFTDYIEEFVAKEQHVDQNTSTLQWRCHYVALNTEDIGDMRVEEYASWLENRVAQWRDSMKC
jgi:hypothetical protein